MALKQGEVRLNKGYPAIRKTAAYLSGLRLSDRNLLIVANSHFAPGGGIQIYGLRWEIETLFGCLKGRSFKLEETRITGYLRIEKLLVLPVIAFCWTHKIGEWKHNCVIPIKIRTHQRKTQSIFRYGLVHQPYNCDGLKYTL